MHQALPGSADSVIQTLKSTPAYARRRMDLAIARQGGGIVVGLRRRQHTEIIDMQECPVLHPALFALIKALRPELHRIQGMRRAGSLIVNLLDSGPDVLLRTDFELNTADRIVLGEFARRYHVARLSWASLRGVSKLGTPEPIAQHGTPFLRMDGTSIQPPPGVFLQASREGENAIVEAVMEGVSCSPRRKSRSPIIELYAGCGTLSFPLTRLGRVLAYEGDAEAVAALKKAAGGRPIVVFQRDLVRQPLQARELNAAEIVVLDPPWAGGGPQIAEIGRSNIRRVIYVSCNPAALARDAMLLRQSGFDIVTATPIDQFLWSARLESVVVFDRR